MIKFLPILILSLFLAYSCSSTKEKKASTKQSVDNDFDFDDSNSSDDDLSDFDDIEELNDDDFGDEPEVASASAGASDDSSEIIYGDDLDDEDFDDDFDDEVSGEFADLDDEFNEMDDFTERSLSSAVTIGGEVGRLKVKRGETLMMIAFNLYGDYTKWKRLRNMNPGINPHSLAAGQVIKYEVPEEEFSWVPNGNPYLIKRGDTLGTISKDKYGTPKKWRDIYNNNRPLIRDPNLIFAGFTIYYIDGESDFAINK